MTLANNRRDAAVVRAAFTAREIDFFENTMIDSVAFVIELESGCEGLEPYQAVIIVEDDGIVVDVSFPRKTDAEHYLSVVDFVNRIHGHVYNQAIVVDTESFEVAQRFATDIARFKAGFEDWFGWFVALPYETFEQFAPGFMAVMDGRQSAAEAFAECTKDDETVPEDASPSVFVGERWHRFK